MTHPTSVQKTMSEQDKNNNMDLSVPLLKDLAKYLHEEVAKHRKTIHNKKKKDFNFRHRVTKHDGRYYSATLRIYKWMQDQMKYRFASSIDIKYSSGDTLHLIRIGRIVGATESAEEIISLANPDAYGQVLEKLIKILDWRG